MLLPIYSLVRAMLILLHIKSLLSESFSTTKLINYSSIEDKIIKKSLKDSLINLDYTKLSRSNKLINESENLFNNLNSNLLFKKIIKRNKNLTNDLNIVEDKHKNTNKSNEEVPSLIRSSYYGYIIFFSRILYGLVCIVGLCGNSLVIYVVLRFSKMQTVTNMYILNLAFADEMFLCGLPFLIITISYNYWAFGWLMCKIYMIMTSINQFTSSLLLTVMSADRYIAVCHPISSPRYRTQCIAKIICLSVWTLSAYLMIPIFIFADIQDTGDKISCNIYWPEMNNNFTGQSAFTSFFVPLMLILLFYFLVICKLRTISTKHKSREKKKTQKKVTYLVLVVITVYISCWLPYWITQVYITFQPPDHKYNEFSFTVMLLAGCLSYANSAVNPILYAFLSENFKKSFKKAFTCAANQDVNAQLHGENSVFPQHLGKGKQSSSSRVETASTYLDSNQNKIKNKNRPNKLKDSKKHQLVNLSNKLNLKKNKRLSLDLSNTQINRLSDELKQNNIERNNLKLINDKSNSNKDEVQLVANEIDQQINNNSELNNIKFKRRRKSEPKLSMNNEFNQSTKNRRRSTLISQEDDIETARTDREESSSNDDIAYETDNDGEYDDEDDDDSSLNSQTKRNCSAMPASLKAKFLSSSSKFRLRTLNLKSKNNKRISSTTNLEVIKSSNNSRKISLASKDSETSQMKRSNKLINFMNKFTNKTLDTKTKEEQTIEKRPENRISRKRISAQEAEHHRFGNLKRIQMNKLECKCENKQGDDKNCINCLNNQNNQTRNSSIYSEENFKNDNNLKLNNLDNENYEIADNNLIEFKSNNDKNNNSNDEQFIKQQENCTVNNYTNNNFCESIECAQCSKCLEKRGVIQTQL